MDDRDNQHYDPKIYRKMHQSTNSFVLQGYHDRMKKCRRCRAVFKDDRPQFVIAHQKLYFYKRVKGIKRIFTTQRDMLYHCDPDCIQPRHSYFHLCDMVTSPSVTRHHNESDIKHLHSLGIFS